MEKENKKLEILNIDYSEYTTRLTSSFKNRKPYKYPDKSKLLSFIPGTVIEILVKEGDRVKKGNEVLVLEAMKMKNRIKSPVSGLVKRIDVKVNERVPKGQLLIELRPDK